MRARSTARLVRAVLLAQIDTRLIDRAVGRQTTLSPNCRRRGMDNPIGVAQYQFVAELPAELQESLPSVKTLTQDTRRGENKLCQSRGDVALSRDILV